MLDHPELEYRFTSGRLGGAAAPPEAVEYIESESLLV
jgi:hypothetical protein